MVGDEEGRPAEGHHEQGQSDDEITLHLGPNVFLVCFHTPMILCDKSKDNL